MSIENARGLQFLNCNSFDTNGVCDHLKPLIFKARGRTRVADYENRKGENSQTFSKADKSNELTKSGCGSNMCRLM